MKLVPPNHKYYQLKNKKRLGQHLNIDYKLLNNIDLSFSSSSFLKVIGNKERELYNPPYSYKRILRRINHQFNQLNLPDYLYGGVRKRSNIDNAKAHLENSYMLKLDIENFFPSIHYSNVYSFFKYKCKMSEDISTIMAKLTTEKNYLPQGFPTSTLLSFLSLFDMFNGIYKLCLEKGVTFTVFVDDLTFSSKKPISKKFEKHVISIIQKNGLKVNIYKNKRYYANQNKTVTGVALKENNELSALLKHQAEAIDLCEKSKNIDTSNLEGYKEFKNALLSLEGKLLYLKSVSINFSSIRQYVESNIDIIGRNKPSNEPAWLDDFNNYKIKSL